MAITFDGARCCDDCGHLKVLHHVAHRHDGGCGVRGCRCELVYFTFGQPIAKLDCPPEQSLSDALGVFGVPYTTHREDADDE